MNTTANPSQVAPGRKRAGRTTAAASAALLALLAAGWFGWSYWTEGRFLEETDDAYVGGDITVLSAKVPANIASVLVTDNQFVHAGDTLVRLDDRDYRAAVAKAEAAVAAQEALLANLDATSALQQAVIAQGRAGIAASDAEVVRSREDRARHHGLAEVNAVSRQSVERVDADYKQAVAQREKAQAAELAAVRELNVIGTRHRQAAAALAQAMADRDLARLNLGYTELRAPIDGIVGNRKARQGAYAGAGASLLSLVPAHGLWVDANFKENQVARMQPGQHVEIKVDVLPGRVFHGHVASLAPATGAQFSVLPAENATGNFTKIVQRLPVRIVLDGADDKLETLRPGLSVVASVDLRAKEQR
ncbi:HlyD family secretion protein [Oxalobacteraceae bacterium OM1]|nr:HlyD family secretion protein [Oxalobacteraceae bacterium OM1]